MVKLSQEEVPSDLGTQEEQDSSLPSIPELQHTHTAKDPILNRPNSQALEENDDLGSLNSVMNEAPLDQALCGCCFKQQDSALSYCNACEIEFCEACWELQIVHRRGRLTSDGIPHEKTNLKVALKINKILQCQYTLAEEEAMHIKDQSNTWFGVVRKQGEPVLLRDYGVFPELMSRPCATERDERSDPILPSLVSFLGQTGGGRSTIIKLLIDLTSDDQDVYATPIPGSTKDQAISVSSDVHLYADPRSRSSSVPLVYIESEGLDGGEAGPLSSRIQNIYEISNGERPLSKHSSDREIKWSNTANKSRREYVALNLYPRILYSFSDTIVYVLKNPKLMETTLGQLLDWGIKSRELSSNQPVLPHLLIIVNGVDNSWEELLWDTEKATAKLLDGVKDLLSRDRNFRKAASFWLQGGKKCDTVEDLLLCYYASIKMIYVPTRGRPNLIESQILKIHSCLENNAKVSHVAKKRLRMLLDAREFQIYTSFALNHFADELDYSFDFVQASFVNRPIPNDLWATVLNTALEIRNVWEDVASGAMIVRELAFMVASCIMLDLTRAGFKGTGKDAFQWYTPSLDRALSEFCDNYWPCEYGRLGNTPGRCVLSKANHGTKGHQLKNGKRIASGSYVSAFSVDAYQGIFHENICTKLENLLKLSQAREEEGNLSNTDAAMEIHHTAVMKTFYSRLMRGRHDTFIVPGACFCCLFKKSKYVLTCGHSLCDDCYKFYDARSFRIRGLASKMCPAEVDFEWLGSGGDGDATLHTGYAWNSRSSIDSARPSTSHTTNTNHDFVSLYSRYSYTFGNESTTSFEDPMDPFSTRNR